MSATHLPNLTGPWPELNYSDWSDTLRTLHMWTQIVGKIRLVSMPWQNHSWHTSLLVNSSGLTTGSMPWGDGVFEIEFSFISQRLHIYSSWAGETHLDLEPMSVAEFYKELFRALRAMGIQPHIHASPNEVEDPIPFAKNERDKSYEPEAVRRFWQAAISTHNTFLQFRSEFIGKCSPVHFFWGAFDLAVTRFSGRPAPPHPGGAPNIPLDVMQEAYSQEVCSAGFWPGSEAFPQPVYYAYCYPTPEGYGDSTVLPEEAFWSEEMGEFFLPYDVVRTSVDPRQTLLDFLYSTYAAGANAAGWDRKALERDWS